LTLRLKKDVLLESIVRIGEVVEGKSGQFLEGSYRGEQGGMD
jgi:hypothetical protein